MNITMIDAKNPVWNNHEKTSIKLEVLFEHLQSEGYVEFVAVPNDLYQHTVELYNKVVAGEFGVIGDYVPEPSITPHSGQIPVTNTGN
jgi:hypothetical protein